MKCFAAALLTLIGLTSAGCESCPDGNASNSLYCHAANCGPEEAVCAGACADLQADRDNCGSCGNACGDGMSCSQGQCVESCALDSETRCAGTCTDTGTDPANCGACGNGCAPSQSCNAGTCGCAPTELVCGTQCTDPMTSATHCGASGDCMGVNAGQVCGTSQVCAGGACVSSLYYRGSLPAGIGRWAYSGVLGLDGANADCEAHFAGSQVCSLEKLMLAQAKGELVNATDYNAVPVTEWWIDDPAAVANERCNFATMENKPWTYGTAHFGHVGKYVTLTPATGTLSTVMTGNVVNGTGLCSQPRAVACCSIVTGP